GPIAIASAAGKQARAGGRYYLFTLAFLSVNLAVLNLLPIPALDGGHLAFFAIEGAMRRPLRPRHREIALQVGILLLITLIVLVGVPTLEALAWVVDAAPGTSVCAALDARKREVYAALFALEAGGPRRLTPDLALAPEALAARLPRPCTIVGDAGEVYGAVL